MMMINPTLSLAPLSKLLRFSHLQFRPPLSATHLHFSTKERRTSRLSSAYTQQSQTQFDQQSSGSGEEWDAFQKEALLKGGEQVVSIMQEMLNLLEDMEMDMEKAAEPVALELVAQGVIGKRVDEMESGFMMALDYMINLAEKDDDTQVLDKMLS